MLEEIIAKLPPSAAMDVEDEDTYPNKPLRSHGYESIQRGAATLRTATRIRARFAAFNPRPPAE